MTRSVVLEVEPLIVSYLWQNIIIEQARDFVLILYVVQEQRHVIFVTELIYLIVCFGKHEHHNSSHVWVFSSDT